MADRRYYMLRRFGALLADHEQKVESEARATADRLQTTFLRAVSMNISLDTIVLALRAARFFHKEGESQLASRFGQLARRADRRDVDEETYFATLAEIRDEVGKLNEELATMRPPAKPLA